MKVANLALLLLMANHTAVARQFCGPPGSLTITGSSTVFPLANAWANSYMQLCPGSTITVKEGGSTAGASSICDDGTDELADIGTMSRTWKTNEATTDNDWKYHCLIGDTSRSAIQINVAIDSLVVSVKKGGSAENCLNAMGGLTLDQLRWMYSSYNVEKLNSTGWDPNSLPHNDYDDNTHLWSELSYDPACLAEEIKISGENGASEVYDFFFNLVLTDYTSGETFDIGRQTGNVSSDVGTDSINYLLKENSAITYSSFSSYDLRKDNISAIAIKNDKGAFVIPGLETITDGTYNPFSRRIYMNLLDNEVSLRDTAPFIAFGLSEEGSIFVSSSGLVPIPRWENHIMHARAGADGSVDLTSIQCGTSGGMITIAGSSVAFPIAKIWTGIYDAACDIHFSVEVGGSSAGAGRVCANPSFGDSVMIGTMSRAWKTGEATSSDESLYKCVVPGNTSRSTIQIDVAIDGLAVVVKKGGRAEACIQAMTGLTIDQLRWIYSNYSIVKLTNSAWEVTSIGNSDGDDSTHLWSELLNSTACPQTEIKISGANMMSEINEFFIQTVLTDHQNGESFGTNRLDGYKSSVFDEDLVAFLEENDDAISFIGFSHYFRNSNALTASAVKNKDNIYVKPNPLSVEDGFYNPLSYRIYMNLLNDEASLEQIRPLIAFAMTKEGASLVEYIGFLAIPVYERMIMLSRARSIGGIDVDSLTCGPPGETITIAGSSTLFPIAKLWGGIYELACDVTVSVEGGGSAVGAGRVCANLKYGTPVDIGDMTRPFTLREAYSDNGYLYNCRSPGDTSRSTVQIEVAIDGLSVATKVDGSAAKCIQALGGLTLDQLRWIYSSYNETQLAAAGWNKAAVPNSDNNTKTHLWSELLDSKHCLPTEIKIGVSDIFSGVYDHFLQTILVDNKNGEVFDSVRSAGYAFGDAADEVLVNYLRDHEDAIAYFGYAFYFANQDELSLVPIRNNAGTFILPSPETVTDGTYNPLSRRIVMNVVSKSLINTRPFVEFGLNNADLVSMTGYVPIPVIDRTEMFSRLSGGVGPVTSPSSGNLITAQDDNIPSSVEAPTDVKEKKKKLGSVLGGIVGGLISIILLVTLFVVTTGKISWKDETFSPATEDVFVPDLNGEVI